MIKILHHNKNLDGAQEFQPDKLSELLKRHDGITWLDLSQEPAGAFEPILLNTFGFHPLAIHDALHESHAAKLDQWDEHIYLVLHGPLTEIGLEEGTETPELDIFLGKRFIVTHHSAPMKAVETVWEMCARDRSIMSGGPDHLVFRLAQEIVREHFRMLDEIEDQVNRIEDRIFISHDRNIPEELFTYKRLLLKERSNVGPLREVFSQLVLDEIPVIDRRDRVFFRDIYEQVLRLDGTVTHLRDLVSSTLDTYLSVVNNRMNDTMRLMAVITTLFLPLTFITGFFGMNFFQAARITETWTGTVAFDIALAAMLLLPFSMFIWMKRRGMF